MVDASDLVGHQAELENRKGGKFAILVGGLGNSGKGEFIDYVYEECKGTGASQATARLPGRVQASNMFWHRGQPAYLLEFPCLWDGTLADARILANVVKVIGKLADTKVSNFVYLVNGSEQERETSTHRMHLQIWSHILGTPSEPTNAKMLFLSSNPMEIATRLRELRPIWEEHISRPATEEIMVTSRERALKVVQEAVATKSHLKVQLQMDLQSVALCETELGKQYIKLLENRIQALKPDKKHRLRVWERPEGPEAENRRYLRESLKHWRKCKLPKDCKKCRFTETQN